jgi:hypothetical protein
MQLAHMQENQHEFDLLLFLEEVSRHFLKLNLNLDLIRKNLNLANFKPVCIPHLQNKD